MAFKINLPNSDIRYYEKFLNEKFSEKLYKYLLEYNNWEKKEIIIFGKKCKQNRKTCVFSYPGLNYRYSGTDNIGEDMNKHPILIEVKNKIEKLFDDKYQFNYILGNKYEDGTENIGMHSDDERDLLGPIASISIGSERNFDFKHKYDKTIKKRLNLKNGSLVIMNNPTQKFYKHGVPIQKKIKDCRINLTYRVVKK